jgi:hypothetical protein
VNRIFLGEKPELPVRAATNFELVINLTAWAKSHIAQAHVELAALCMYGREVACRGASPRFSTCEGCMQED